ncbi:MAG TPA: DUF1592 domain-containing protein, partial [Polyangiaceae bacterium]
VALTSFEHARSILELAGAQIEPLKDENTRNYYGQTLPFAPTYHPARLSALAAAARAAASELKLDVTCLNEGQEPEACALDFIDGFVKRVYRRPLAESERSRYLGLFRSALAGSEFTIAVRTLVEAALQSPHFLYKVELTNGPLSDYELATRLSYFLTAAPPDAELSAHADAGTLLQNLEGQLNRLSASPAFAGSMRELYGAWLGLDHLSASELVPAELVQAMRAETEGFFDWHVAADAPLASLLTESFTFLDAPMATHYGLPAPASGRERFELDGARYAGALTQASFMTAFSTPTPRGKWIRSRLLCSPPPDPPAGIDFPSPPGPGEDTRTWIEQATADPACRSCHQLTDPFGFAFQSFDELGRWRSANDVVKLQLDDGTQREVRGPAELASALLAAGEVLECTRKHWVAWALKRVPGERLQCELEQATSTLWSEMTTRDMVKAIASSDAFVNGGSAALSVDEPMLPAAPAPPLGTEAARSTAARELVLQELEALLRKFPKDPSLSSYQQALQALAAP